MIWRRSANAEKRRRRDITTSCAQSMYGDRKEECEDAELECDAGTDA